MSGCRFVIVFTFTFTAPVTPPVEQVSGRLVPRWAAPVSAVEPDHQRSRSAKRLLGRRSKDHLQLWHYRFESTPLPFFKAIPRIWDSQQCARNGGGVIEGGRLVGRASRPTGAALRGLRFVAGCRWGASCAMGGVGVLAATWAWSIPPSRPRKAGGPRRQQRDGREAVGEIESAERAG